MKAWRVEDKYGDEYKVAIVFAETRGRAKSSALYCSETFVYSEYIDLIATRCPQMDKYYTEGKYEMDWENPNDRLAMVRDLGFRKRILQQRRGGMRGGYRQTDYRKECKKCGFEFLAPAVRTGTGKTFLWVDHVNYCPRCGANIKKLWEEM